MRNFAVKLMLLGVSCSWLALGACSDDSGTTPTADAGTEADAGTTTPTDCTSASTHIDQVVCASNAFLATLTDAQRTTAQLAWTDQAAKTRWSNLPGVTRTGITWGAMSAESKVAALHLASLVLTEEGYADMTGIFAADDYLAANGGNSGGGGGGGGPSDGGTGGPPGGDGGMGGGGGPPGGDGGMGGGGAGGYGAGNYILAFIGTPSATGSWMLQIGGHHMAFNVTYLNGTGYPTPNHLGVEPKASFTQGGTAYAPLADDGTDFAAVFKGLDATQLNQAYLPGTFSDVVLGPVEYGAGSYAKVVFPAQQGLLVSSLTSAQQALVTAAIKKWVNDFAPAIAEPLLAEYTSAAAYGQTYIGWGGSQSTGINVDVNGTYFRIDGPRLWLELDCQSGVVIRNATHYHTIYRDKKTDYGNQLSQ